MHTNNNDTHTQQPTRPLDLGRLSMTSGFVALIGDEEQAEAKAIEILNRYRAADWGDLDTYDKVANDTERHWAAGHVLGAYHVAGVKVYVETCWNEDGYRTTCVMLAEER